MKMFMSPAMVRRASSAVSSPLARRKASNLDDERDLIIPSPTDSECNSIVNGNDLVDSGSGSGTGSGSGNAGDLASSVPETGFSLPKFKSNMRSSKVRILGRILKAVLLSFFSSAGSVGPGSERNGVRCRRVQFAPP